MINTAGPVLVTTATVWVSILLTRLFPKLKAEVLNDAVVTGVAIAREMAALCMSVPDVPVRAILAVPGVAVDDADMLICP